MLRPPTRTRPEPFGLPGGTFPGLRAVRRLSVGQAVGRHRAAEPTPVRRGRAPRRGVTLPTPRSRETTVTVEREQEQLTRFIRVIGPRTSGRPESWFVGDLRKVGGRNELQLRLSPRSSTLVAAKCAGVADGPGPDYRVRGHGRRRDRRALHRCLAGCCRSFADAVRQSSEPGGPAVRLVLGTERLRQDAFLTSSTDELDRDEDGPDGQPSPAAPGGQAEKPWCQRHRWGGAASRTGPSPREAVPAAGNSENAALSCRRATNQRRAHTTERASGTNQMASRRSATTASATSTR